VGAAVLVGALFAYLQFSQQQDMAAKEALRQQTSPRDNLPNAGNATLPPSRQYFRPMAERCGLSVRRLARSAGWARDAVDAAGGESDK